MEDKYGGKNCLNHDGDMIFMGFGFDKGKKS